MRLYRNQYKPAGGGFLSQQVDERLREKTYQKYKKYLYCTVQFKGLIVRFVDFSHYVYIFPFSSFTCQYTVKSK